MEDKIEKLLTRNVKPKSEFANRLEGDHSIQVNPTAGSSELVGNYSTQVNGEVTKEVLQVLKVLKN